MKMFISGFVVALMLLNPVATKDIFGNVFDCVCAIVANISYNTK
jgi:hypothetical protein